MSTRHLVTWAATAISMLFLIAAITTVAIVLAWPPEPSATFSQSAPGFLAMILWLVFLLALLIGVVAWLLAWMSRQPWWVRAEASPEAMPIGALPCVRGEIDYGELQRIALPTPGMCEEREGQALDKAQG